MRALQSDLFKRMKKAGINVTAALLSGKTIVFEGVTYVLKKVRRR